MYSGSIENHYDALGVSSTATAQEIKAAYRELAKSLHPDRNKFGSQLFKRINEAHEVLSDPVARQAYDRDPDAPPKQTTDPPSPQANEAAGSDNDTTWKEAFLNSCLCFICGETVDKQFLEAPCCGGLCCVQCLEKKYPQCKYGRNSYALSATCPNSSCKTPIDKKNHERHFGWTNSSKFIQKQLDSVAPPHICGKNVLPEHLKQHEFVCPKLNTSCWKCSGNGKFTTTAGNEVKCDACQGRKVLAGLDWVKCFKCQGRGAFNTVMNTVVNCSTCKFKGALQGKWTMCFKCQGQGAYNTGAGLRINCPTCKSSGAFKGYNLGECSFCKGCGCGACNWNGSVKCQCGPSCKGHSNHFTPRYNHFTPRKCYESDSSSDSDW